jgi:hypothetical protein
VRAEPGVVLFEQADLRKGLCAALRIQLSDAADVTCTPDRAGADLAERLRVSAEQVRSQGALLGVLVERDPDPGRVRMYILSSQTDQAVIAIEAIEDRPEPDVDRSLALKVRNTFELVGYVRAQAKAPIQASPLPAVLAPAPPPPPAAPPGRHWLMLFDAGGGLALGNELRAVASVALGVGRQQPGSRWELALGARLYSERSESQDGLRLNMVERGPSLAGRWLWRRGRFELGGALEAQLSVLKARGQARDGTEDTARRVTPLFSPGLDLRVRLFSTAFLRFSPSLEIPLVQRALQVDGETLIQDKPVRGTLPLSLVMLLPLTRESVQP